MHPNDYGFQKRLITIKSTSQIFPQILKSESKDGDPVLGFAEDVPHEVISRLRESLYLSAQENIKVYYSPQSLTEKAPARQLRVSNSQSYIGCRKQQTAEGKPGKRDFRSFAGPPEKEFTQEDDNRQRSQC